MLDKTRREFSSSPFNAAMRRTNKVRRMPAAQGELGDQWRQVMEHRRVRLKEKRLPVSFKQNDLFDGRVVSLIKDYQRSSDSERYRALSVLCRAVRTGMPTRLCKRLDFSKDVLQDLMQAVDEALVELLPRFDTRKLNRAVVPILYRKVFDKLKPIVRAELQWQQRLVLLGMDIVEHGHPDNECDEAEAPTHPLLADPIAYVEETYKKGRIDRDERAIVYYTAEKKKSPEIGRRLGIKPFTVRKKLQRVREFFQEELQQTPPASNPPLPRSVKSI
jgi:hypothetical protein